jgi:MFS family permease
MEELRRRATGNSSFGYKAYVLFILVVVYTFNFIDRQIISILAEPIKHELELSDTQLGLLGGPMFGLLYATLGIPIAWLADRKSRVWIMTISLAVWSAFTALCGLANSFGKLALARMGVGIGEAGGVAPAYSLISDYFPREARGRALAVYSFGIPIGSALGILFGGFMASEVSWRAAFIWIGLAGVILAPVFRLTVADPRRGQYDAEAASKEAPALRDVLRTLSTKGSFWQLAVGASSGSILGYGLMFWLPAFFQRSWGMDLKEVALLVASIVFVGGVVGMFAGGALVDKLGSKGVRYYAAIPAVAASLAIPAFAVAILSPSRDAAFFLFVIPQALCTVWLGPVITTLQHLVPPNMRTTASALFLFINNLIGLGLGALLFGALSDKLRPYYGEDALRYALLCGLGFFVVSAIMFLAASRRLERDWHR